MYTPTVIGENISLPKELDPLIELLAENNHNVWARTRISQGWTYDPVRDDKVKHHDNLVPFAELPEAEKEIDRELGRSVLRVAIELGYKIEPPA